MFNFFQFCPTKKSVKHGDNSDMIHAQMCAMFSFLCCCVIAVTENITTTIDCNVTGTNFQKNKVSIDTYCLHHLFRYSQICCTYFSKFSQLINALVIYEKKQLSFKLCYLSFTIDSLTSLSI